MARRRLIHYGKSLSTRLTLRELDRFRKFIVEQDGHWLWTGRLDENGYGQFWFRGQARPAHRVSYAMLRGPIRNGNDVDHDRRKCDIARCVHPHHLRQLSRHANSSDGGRARSHKEPAPF